MIYRYLQCVLEFLLQEQSETLENDTVNRDDSHIASTSLSSISPQQPVIKRKKPVGPIARQNELLNLACKYLSASTAAEPEDKYLQIAQVWANKLRGLDSMQMRYAEKAINDVLFEAEMGT